MLVDVSKGAPRQGLSSCDHLSRRQPERLGDDTARFGGCQQHPSEQIPWATALRCHVDQCSHLQQRPAAAAVVAAVLRRGLNRKRS